MRPYCRSFKLFARVGHVYRSSVCCLSQRQHAINADFEGATRTWGSGRGRSNIWPKHANVRFTLYMNEEFRSRLLKLFDNLSMADIARRLKIPHATVRNYFGGRLPATEVLIKIADETGVSINWLLLGRGEMYAVDTPPVDLGKIFEDKIEELIDRKLGSASVSPRAQRELTGMRDHFDLDGALDHSDDPQYVMGEWLRHEGRQFPSDYGVVFFRGWNTFTRGEKIDALLDAKKVLDRSTR